MIERKDYSWRGGRSCRSRYRLVVFQFGRNRGDDAAIETVGTWVAGGERTCARGC